MADIVYNQTGTIKPTAPRSTLYTIHAKAIQNMGALLCIQNMLIDFEVSTSSSELHNKEGENESANRRECNAYIKEML